MIDIAVLQSTKLLDGLSVAQLQALIDASTIATYHQHQVVFTEHSQDRELYIILAGQVSVVVDPTRLGTVDQGWVDPRAIHPLGPSEAFGEIGFLTGEPRNATIIATRDATQLLIIQPETYEMALRTQTILRNLAIEVSRKLGYSNTRIMEDTLATYYINVLVEELAAGTYDCSPTMPFLQLTVIRNPESFVICGPGRLIAELPAKETIEVALFANPITLQTLVGPGSPTGQAIFSTLFSIIRTGTLIWRADDATITVRLDADDDRRRGWLTVTRALDEQTRTFTIRWQLKGARLHADTRTASANLFMQVWSDEQLATDHQVRRFIDAIAMPVQRSILDSLQSRGRHIQQTRALIIHHRSHEVARTLQTLQQLGFQIDCWQRAETGILSRIWLQSSLVIRSP
jgi:CRP-like cAMP-binding protein